MSTSSRSITVEQRSRQKKNGTYIELLTAKLQILKTKRPDVYSEQIAKLEGYHSDVEPCDLLEPDKLLVAAGALQYMLECSDVTPSTAPGILNNAYELPPSSHSARSSSQSSDQHDLSFVRDLDHNFLGSQTSCGPHSSQPAAPSIQPFAPEGSHVDQATQGAHITQPLK